MGRIYKPVEVSFEDRKITTVGLVDTGADESVMSERLAKKISAELYGRYKAFCASQYVIRGRYTDVTIKDLKSGKYATLKVGVSDIPFDTDDINDEGLEIILCIDFIQSVNLVELR